MERKSELWIVTTTCILCLFIFCLTGYAQPRTECSHGTHEYVSQVLTPSSEDAQGKVENTCIYCGDSYIEYLPATGHVFGPWEEVGEAGKDGQLEWHVCSQCQRSEERVIALTVSVSEEQSKESGWEVNQMDYVLTATTGGVWGYVALALWRNGLVLNWYKRECLKKKKEKR